MSITNFGEFKTAVANWLQRDDATDRIPEFVAMTEDRIGLDLRVRAMERRAALRITPPVNGGTVSGSDTITLTPTTAATAYTLGDTYTFEAAANNTTAVTINISGLGAKNLKIREGGILRDPAADELIDGVDYYIYYDGTQFLLTPQGAVPVPANFVGARDLHLAGSEKSVEFLESSAFWRWSTTTTTGQIKYYTIEGDYILFSHVPDTTYTGWLLFWRKFTALSADSDTNWIISNARGLLLFGTLLEASIFYDDTASALRYGTLYEDHLERAHRSNERDRIPQHARSRVPGITP